MGSAATMTDCEILRIDKKAMVAALHREHAFSDLFVTYLLARTSVMRKISSTSCSTPAKSAWREFSFCWPILAKKACGNRGS